ncbi:hypothetical protein [Luteimonas aquatica]|uniref:hypothetical protein n=1 Tax=Luteimonas aquatica TaxID=450364 RepID=UPI001F57E780|nr:hypothetical protein [Luteimonas aquatica]
MKRSLSYLRNGALAAAVLGCLAFGAGQALATADRAGSDMRPVCPSTNCRAECGPAGGERMSVGGRCLCCAVP